MSGVQSIERAFALLRALAVGPSGVTDLAERVDLPKSTVSRLLSALESEEAVEQVEVGGLYRLGPTVSYLAGASSPGNNLVAAARPFLIDLTDLTNETSGVSVIDDDEVYYLEHVETDDHVQVRDWTGESLPLHWVASGLALLAYSPPRFVEDYLSRPLDAATENTMTDPRELRKRLKVIRKTGYVWVYQEFNESLNSVAAAVLQPDGAPVCALHIHGPAYRFPDDDAERYGRLVSDAATKLAAVL